MSEDFKNVNNDTDEGKSPVTLKCKNGHEWESDFYLNSNYDFEFEEPYCPICGEIGEETEGLNRVLTG